MRTRLALLRGPAIIAGAALASILLPGCLGGEGCTEIGCSSEATVVYSRAVGQGYWLDLEIGGESALALCNAPPMPDMPENPEWLSCNASGFEIVGELAGNNSVLVLLYLDDDDQTVLASNADVSLATSPEGVQQPNGPDCEPTCYVRRGDLELAPAN